MAASIRAARLANRADTGPDAPAAPASSRTTPLAGGSLGESTAAPASAPGSSSGGVAKSLEDHQM